MADRHRAACPAPWPHLPALVMGSWGHVITRQGNEWAEARAAFRSLLITYPLPLKLELPYTSNCSFLDFKNCDLFRICNVSSSFSPTGFKTMDGEIRQLVATGMLGLLISKSRRKHMRGHADMYTNTHTHVCIHTRICRWAKIQHFSAHLSICFVILDSPVKDNFPCVAHKTALKFSHFCLLLKMFHRKKKFCVALALE